MNLFTSFKTDLINLVQTTFDLTSEQTKSIDVTLKIENRSKFGDLSCNAAMVCARHMTKPGSKSRMTPRELAAQLQEAIGSFTLLTTHIEKTEIAGPGFLNIYLKQSFWAELTSQFLSNHTGFFKHESTYPFKKYLLEFVSANPTGPLHLGHGRGGIIGDVLAKVLTFLGHTADREFYINDAGVQMKKLGECLQERIKELAGQPFNIPDDGYQGDYLIDLAKEFVSNYDSDVVTHEPEEFVRFAEKHLLQIQRKTLEHYGITYQKWFSERTLHPHAVERALAILKEKGLLYEKEGALWFKATEFGDEKDRVIKKADGNYTYIAADIAYHKKKYDRGYDQLINILGQDHHGYVMRLKGTMQALGYKNESLDVILYQLVKINDAGVSVKMSKRAGTFTELQEVIDIVGPDVARFFYLNRKAEAHLEFDLATALKKTDENPVFYIQYAYVRTGSLFVKAGKNEQLTSFVDTLTKGNGLNVSDYAQHLGENDFSLLKKISSLHSILHTVERSYQTHVLSFYTIELTQLFHAYYTNNRIVVPDNIEQSKARLIMVKIMRETLGLCLDLLGLSKPERM